MEESLTNSKWKHDVGCKATHTKNIVDLMSLVLFTVMPYNQKAQIMTYYRWE